MSVSSSRQNPPGPRRQIARLRRELAPYAGNGRWAPGEPVQRLERGLQRRRSRLDFIDRQLAELLEERHTLEAEAAGIEKGLALLLGTELQQVEDRFGPCWSPAPVLGYRMWAVRGDGLWGVKDRWPGPEMTATCLRTKTDVDVPHDDGRCGRLGCGVYASKDFMILLAQRPVIGGDGTAVGLVELSGKVVEHQRGYRAARARTIAVAVPDVGGGLCTGDPEEIARLFAAPLQLLDRAERTAPSVGEIREFLSIEERMA